MSRNIKQATPPWASPKGIRAWYKLARKIGKTVDHIVPVSHPLVCGLHCEDNFRLITLEQNIAKSNHWWPDAPFEAQQMFNDPMRPEQYEFCLDITCILNPQLSLDLRCPTDTDVTRANAEHE